jgi:hypothetical protein
MLDNGFYERDRVVQEAHQLCADANGGAVIDPEVLELAERVCELDVAKRGPTREALAAWSQARAEGYTEKEQEESARQYLDEIRAIDVEIDELIEQLAKMARAGA